MLERTVTILNPTGLHARPAKIFVDVAKQYKAKVRIRHGEKNVNAKSMLSMLTLGVEAGSDIIIEVEGEDEDAAMEALVEAVESGLGEEELIADTAPEAALEKTPAEPAQPDEDADDGGIGGVAAAPGIAIGDAFQWRPATVTVDDTFTTVFAAQAELEHAVAAAREELVALRDEVRHQTGVEEAAIFDVHLELLEDPELQQSVADNIDRQMSAGRAWQTAVEARAEVVAGIADPLLAARAADLRDVGDRVLRLLGGDTAAAPELPDGKVILVAKDLSPSETASLDIERILGICTAAGGATDHAAIIARARGLPAVVNAGERVLDIPDGTQMIVNGATGRVYVDPDEATLTEARAVQARRAAARAAAVAAAANAAITQDGRRVEVGANAANAIDSAEAHAAGAEGIGLLRTEFLFLKRATAPDEEVQATVYSDILRAMEGQPVVFRTLDVGGDKPLDYIDVPAEENPFLGVRGLRLALSRPDLLQTQLKALLRAAVHGPTRIMFPMVANVAEWRQARQAVEEAAKAVGKPDIQLGIMIEIPAAALLADAFAPEIDFFSIGTNDLTQYTLAMDRTHPKLAGRLDGLHPAVLRLIDMTVRAAHAKDKWVGVCGELGADPTAIPILVGLGVDELSVNVPAVPLVKAQIRSLDAAACADLAQRALSCASPAAVRQLVHEVMPPEIEAPAA